MAITDLGTRLGGSYRPGAIASMSGQVSHVSAVVAVLYEVLPIMTHTSAATTVDLGEGTASSMPQTWPNTRNVVYECRTCNANELGFCLKATFTLGRSTGCRVACEKHC